MYDSKGVQIGAVFKVEVVDELKHQLSEFTVMWWHSEEILKASLCQFRWSGISIHKGNSCPLSDLTRGGHDRRIVRTIHRMYAIFVQHLFSFTNSHIWFTGMVANYYRYFGTIKPLQSCVFGQRHSGYVVLVIDNIQSGFNSRYRIFANLGRCSCQWINYSYFNILCRTGNWCTNQC